MGLRTIFRPEGSSDSALSEGAPGLGGTVLKLDPKTPRRLTKRSSSYSIRRRSPAPCDEVNSLTTKGQVILLPMRARDNVLRSDHPPLPARVAARSHPNTGRLPALLYSSRAEQRPPRDLTFDDFLLL